MKLWFGVHKDKELADVPAEYLTWLLNGTEPDIGKHDSPATTKLKRERWMELMEEVENELDSRHTSGKKGLADPDDDFVSDDDEDHDSFAPLRF